MMRGVDQIQGSGSSAWLRRRQQGGKRRAVQLLAAAVVASSECDGIRTSADAVKQGRVAPDTCRILDVSTQGPSEAITTHSSFGSEPAALDNEHRLLHDLKINPTVDSKYRKEKSKRMSRVWLQVPRA